MKKNLTTGLIGKRIFPILTSTFLLIVLLITSSCNDNTTGSKEANPNDPAEVALEFYHALNNSQPEQAKMLALPSTIEFIELLEQAKAFDFPGDTTPIKLMEVSKQEPPKQGDTAIVNYKIGDFKSSLTLIYTDGSYKVAFTDDLKAVRVITLSSLDFYAQYTKNDNLFCKKFTDTRMRIHNLVAGRVKNYRNKVFAIPFDNSNFTSPLKKPEWNRFQNWEYFIVYYKDSEIAMTSTEEAVDHSYDFKFQIVTIDEDLKGKLGEYKNDSYTGTSLKPRQRTTRYSNRISFEGVLRDCDFSEVVFRSSIITVLE